MALGEGPRWWAEKESWWIAVYVMMGALLGVMVGTGREWMPGIPEPIALTVRLLLTTAVWMGPSIAHSQTDGLIFAGNGE
jgi:hypothetical protein